eukprot:m51a1_g12797 hypothetical protein (277) ;mRNA; r:1876-2968
MSRTIEEALSDDALQQVLARLLPSRSDIAAARLVCRRWRRVVASDAFASCRARTALLCAGCSAESLVPGMVSCCGGSWGRLCQSLTALSADDECAVPAADVRVLDGGRLARSLSAGEGSAGLAFVSSLALAEGSGVWLLRMAVRRRTWAMAVGVVDEGAFLSGCGGANGAPSIRDGGDPEYHAGWTAFYHGGSSFNVIHATEPEMCERLAPQFSDVAVVVDMNARRLVAFCDSNAGVVRVAASSVDMYAPMPLRDGRLSFNGDSYLVENGTICSPP